MALHDSVTAPFPHASVGAGCLSPAAAREEVRVLVPVVSALGDEDASLVPPCQPVSGVLGHDVADRADCCDHHGRNEEHRNGQGEEPGR
jgi:hypothetical protein